MDSILMRAAAFVAVHAAAAAIRHFESECRKQSILRKNFISCVVVVVYDMGKYIKWIKHATSSSSSQSNTFRG